MHTSKAFKRFKHYIQKMCSSNFLLVPQFKILLICNRYLFHSKNLDFILFIKRQKKKALKKFGLRTLCSKKPLVYRVVHHFCGEISKLITKI